MFGVEPQNSFSARNFQNNFEESNISKSQQPPLSSFRIDRKMLPESPETFMRNWENNRSAGLPSAKSPIRELGTIKKEPIMIHHAKGRSEHELKATTPEKPRNMGSNELIEKINEGKEIYRSGYYGGDAEEMAMFVYDCGHCLSGNVKGSSKKINGMCPGCQSLRGSGNKWNGSGGKGK